MSSERNIYAMPNLNTSFDWRAEHVASRESKYTYFLG